QEGLILRTETLQIGRLHSKRLVFALALSARKPRITRWRAESKESVRRCNEIIGHVWQTGHCLGCVEAFLRGASRGKKHISDGFGPYHHIQLKTVGGKGRVNSGLVQESELSKRLVHSGSPK